MTEEQIFNGIVLGHSWKTIFGVPDCENTRVVDRYIDFPLIFATAKTKLCNGKGFTFTTKDERIQKLWDIIKKDSRLNEKIDLLLFNMCFYGKAVGAFSKLPNDEYRFYVVGQTNFKPYLTKVYEDIVGVSILRETITSENKKYFMRERWNVDNVERDYWYDEKQITTMAYKTPIPKEYFEKLREPNPFRQWNIIPFQDFPNYTFSDKPDWFAVIRYLPLFNQKIEFLERELRLNKTRVAMALTAKQSDAVIKNNSNPEKIDSDYVIQVGRTMDGDPSKLVQNIPSSVRITELQAEISNQIKELFSLSGLSYNNTIENPQTATEVSSSMSGLTNTIIKTQRTFNENFTLLLEKFFIVNGIDKPDFAFSLNENTAIDQATIINEATVQLNNGLITRAKAHSLINNVSIEEAEIEISKVDKEVEMMPQQLDGMNPSNTKPLPNDEKSQDGAENGKNDEKGDE